MPTYVYRFVDTGDTIEVQQSFTDPALTEAVDPRDGIVRAVKKVFTPVGITFKGNGFYKTDSRGNGGSSRTSSSESKSSSSESSTSSSTSESKSDTKSSESKPSPSSSSSSSSSPSSPST